MTLVELIAQDLRLRRSGRYFIGVDHDSLVIDTKRGRWNWYSRGKWGDAKDWIMFWRGLPKDEAGRLAKECEQGVYVPEPPKPLKMHKFAEFYKALPYSERALQYVANRGISEKWQIEARLGYNKGAISIPLMKSGELWSVRYRAISPRSKKRYWSEGGSRNIYPYGLPFLLGRETLFLAEGEFKCLIVNQMGFDCIATAGSTFMPGWTEFTRPYKRVVLLRDSYELPGLTMAKRVRQIIPNVEIVRIPNGHKAIDDFYIADPEKAKEFLLKLS